MTNIFLTTINSKIVAYYIPNCIWLNITVPNLQILYFNVCENQYFALHNVFPHIQPSNIPVDFGLNKKEKPLYTKYQWDSKCF